MCLVVTKEHWLTKNKDVAIHKRRRFLLSIWRKDVPYDWCYFTIPISPHKLDLNELVEEAIEKNKVKRLKVELSPHEKALELRDAVPELELRRTELFLPIVLHRSEIELICNVSARDLLSIWSGMSSKCAAASTAIHHMDRTKYVMQSYLLREILTSGIDDAISTIRKYTSRYMMAGFTIVACDEERKLVADHLFGKLFIGLSKIRPKGILSTLSEILATKAISYDDVIVRSNFSPTLGYWDLDWNPSEEKDKVRKFKLASRIARYLRAHELFEKGSLSFDKILKLMSDHLSYRKALENLAALWELVKGDEINEALKLIKERRRKRDEFAICKHSQLGIDTVTISNFTFNVEKKRAMFVLGNPCKRTLVAFYELS